MDAEWHFSQDHTFPILFRTTTETEMLAGSNSDAEREAMSSPQIRRADRSMSDERALETLAQGYSGRLATVSEDGFPYCIPLLYLWIGGEVYLHTASARGHLRANIESEPRVCFEIDEQEGVFDYGRFECDSGLAYRSVCVFGRRRIVEHRAIKQRVFEARMAKSVKQRQLR